MSQDIKSLDFTGRVAIITGAGGGLGRAYALELARRGARIVVNDLGGARDGTGGSVSAAQAVVDQITQAGGTAIANGANVTDAHQVDAMVAQAISAFGKIDILINNAGILRDKSFGKMSVQDWRLVIDVHLTGSAICARAVWPGMRANNYGRIVMTTSTSGIYGNFGQANYGAAKAGVVGLMNTLCIEGGKNNIHINAISPTAATRMTEDMMSQDMLAALGPENVVPGVVFLCSEQAPNRRILLAGAGTYAHARLMESKGVFLPENERTAENIAAHWQGITDMDGAFEVMTGSEHVGRILANAQK